MTHTENSSLSEARWYRAPGGFFMLPRALCYDDRLTHAQRTVLLVLSSCVFSSDEIFPSRRAMHSLSGIDVSDISSHTTTLEKLGWLTKSIEPGQTTRYTLKVPDYAVTRMTRLKTEAEAHRVAARKRREIRRALWLSEKAVGSEGGQK